MSKFTLAVIAATSAAAGAAATAAIYSSRSKPSPTTSISTTTTSTSTAPSPVPSRPESVLRPALVSPVDPTGLFQYGFPGPIADLRPAASLTSSYDRRLRNPAWVAEHITPESLATKAGDRKHSVFYEDPSIPDKFRAKLRDYVRSGFDRGHQVPAADAKWSQEAMDATFALSNMCPQVGEGFNRDYWAHFEDFCRRLTLSYPSVRIVTGPLYLPKRDAVDGKWRVSYEMIGSPPSVAVPTHFFKVIFAEDGRVGGTVAVGAFVLPNDRIPNEKSLQDFEVPIEAIERASGLEFAGRLPDIRKKKLCEEIACSIIVKEYKDRQLTFQKSRLLK
jgi:endonuclease G, mitochondrial